MSQLQMNIHNLPHEMLISIFCKLSDIKDIISLLTVDSTIRTIIKNRINYIIKKVSINNINTYPQLYQIITYCYPNAPTVDNIIYNVGSLIKINKFISSISKFEIIHQSSELVFNALQFTRNQKANYYRIRVFNNISHFMGMMAVIHLNIEQIIKMLDYIKDGINESNAFDIAEMEEDAANKVFELKHRLIDTTDAIRAVNELTEVGINTMFELIGHGVSPENAIDAIQDLTENQLTNFIKLTKIGISNNFAETIVKKFDDEKIINFINLIEKKVDEDIAYDVADVFEKEKIKKFINIIFNNIDSYVAYNIIKFYNKLQTQVVINLVKNDIEKMEACEFVEKYDETNLSKFMDLIFDGIDIKTAMDIIISKK
jgi:hypothetical protein